MFRQKFFRTDEAYIFFVLIGIITGITLYRLFILATSPYDLYVDEVYYWFWAQNLDFGYFSKPPMVAWTIAFFTHLCGDSAFCIKLPSILIYPFTTIFIYKIAIELFQERPIAFWSALLFFTLPSIFFSSLIISTDVLLLFFWTVTLYLFIKALKTEKRKWWILAGITAGLGLLTKYTMIIFIISVFLYLFTSNKYKYVLKQSSLYMSMAISALLYTPNLFWNYQNHFVSFLHTKEISQIDKELFHFNKMFEFLGSQLGVFGPVFFIILIFLFIKPKITDENLKLLYTFIVPFLLIITLQSFLSRAFANWAAPSYIAATILVAYYLIKNQKYKLLYFGLALNILISVIFYHYHSIMHLLEIPLTSKNDPYKRVSGWKQLGGKVEPFLHIHPMAKLLCDERTTMSELLYYVKPHLIEGIMWNPSGHYQNHFDLVTDMQKHIGEDFVYVTQKKEVDFIFPYFEKHHQINHISIPLYKDFSLNYTIVYLEGFKGYDYE